jgi:hypothetical protein
MYVTSPAQTVFGAAGTKSRATRFGAIGRSGSCDSSIRVGGAAKAVLLAIDDALASRETRDPLLSDANAAPAKRAVHARTAVASSALPVRRRYFDREPLIAPVASPASAASPRVEPAARNLERLAEHLDRVVRLLRIDEFEHHPFSLAKGERRKKAAAFF